MIVDAGSVMIGQQAVGQRGTEFETHDGFEILALPEAPFAGDASQKKALVLPECLNRIGVDTTEIGVIP